MENNSKEENYAEIAKYYYSLANDLDLMENRLLEISEDISDIKYYIDKNTPQTIKDMAEDIRNMLYGKRGENQ